MFQVTTLTRLRINNNTLSGSIPSEVGKLSNIEELNIGGNAITGTLPTSLFELSSLINFRCSDAALTGTLSPAIMQLNSTLRSLHLANNKMSGPLPIAAIESMTYLSKFHLEYLCTLYPFHVLTYFADVLFILFESSIR
jgi:Leucine-rich repeat (LRR) protein